MQLSKRNKTTINLMFIGSQSWFFVTTYCIDGGEGTENSKTLLSINQKKPETIEVSG